jgi:hypothetical protein
MEVVRLESATGLIEVRECCQKLVALLPSPDPYHRERFTAGLGRLLGGTVKMVPLGLPMACSSLWLGLRGADRIGYNADWPEHEIELAGHVIGHLMLGHCGDVRDGGQFVCMAGSLGDDDSSRLCRLLHDPDIGVSRLFSDFEERAATVFSRVLAEHLGLQQAQPGDDGHYTADPLMCVGNRSVTRTVTRRHWP